MSKADELKSVASALAHQRTVGVDNRIAQLEKENTNLRDNYDQFKAIAEPEIERLKKENAELKEESDFYNKERGNYKAMYLEEILKKKKTKDQLIKAKEIIKDLLNLPFANNEEVYADITSHLDRAEQFLKEIEK